MSGVPEHWIPFVPVHVAGANREIQLQRAALPRLIEGDRGPVERVRAADGAVARGLDARRGRPYFLHEEEVPRAGVRVIQALPAHALARRPRRSCGSARARGTGRGEGSSGLRFDQLADVT